MKTNKNYPINPTDYFYVESSDKILQTNEIDITKLELATFMAMQGLCANSNIISASSSEISFSVTNIINSAKLIALSTIELLKEEDEK